MPRPIESVSDFVKALRGAHRAGYEFTLVSTYITEQHKGRRRLHKHGALYWRSPSMSLWGPVEIVAYHHFQRKEHGPWLSFRDAQERIGISLRKAEMIYQSASATPGYNRVLRKRLLKAVCLYQQS